MMGLYNILGAKPPSPCLEPPLGVLWNIFDRYLELRNDIRHSDRYCEILIGYNVWIIIAADLE